MVAVAQLVERRLVVPVVAGSIPVSHPISPETRQYAFADPLVEGAVNGVCFRFVNLNLLFGILGIQKGMSALGVQAKTPPWRGSEIKGEK